ncbi:MAG: hypothetical protein H7A23_08830 [Leptospiraceae bacterium]|nr:hypothetical protein [Leptospiraceae bacterium]MCP5494649.1 hypothetical protein [Leptospiraceae bacterium]
MNPQEKALARIIFQNKIHRSKGQAFEDLFTSIMNYLEPDFQAIKPWGNIGDRKNDGYIKSKGIFFQVYAPEDLQKSYTDAVNKLKKDFNGLYAQWNPIYEFYFVVNDEYQGLNADCENAIQEIKNNYKLKNAGFLTAKDMENRLFSLNDDQIFSIIGFFPDPAKIKQLDYNILNEVIKHIMQLPIGKSTASEIVLPDWDKKIQFNQLSKPIASWLNNGYYQLHDLEKYLKNNSDFLADSLRDKMNEIYLETKKNREGDDLFWEIVNKASPRTEKMYQTSVIVIMSKYFETCDVFEEPKEGNSN